MTPFSLCWTDELFHKVAEDYNNTAFQYMTGERFLRSFVWQYVQCSKHDVCSSVPAEETGVDLGQKKDSYFYSCCHNNWCWVTGSGSVEVPEQNLDMLDGCWTTRLWIWDPSKKKKKFKQYCLYLIDVFFSFVPQWTEGWKTLKRRICCYWVETEFFSPSYVLHLILRSVGPSELDPASTPNNLKLCCGFKLKRGIQPNPDWHRERTGVGTAVRREDEWFVYSSSLLFTSILTLCWSYTHTRH